jgi:flagellar basal-body rod protein FlgC
MSLDNIFNIAGSAMSAQSIRLNTTASNMANAETLAGSEDKIYRAKEPVFATILADRSTSGDSTVGGVKVLKIIESQAPSQKRYEPGNPIADKDGYVYMSNVNVVEEMANMISASRAYQNNVEIMSTAKQMIMSTLKLGQ